MLTVSHHHRHCCCSPVRWREQVLYFVEKERKTVQPCTWYNGKVQNGPLEIWVNWRKSPANFWCIKADTLVIQKAIREIRIWLCRWQRLILSKAASVHCCPEQNTQSQSSKQTISQSGNTNLPPLSFGNGSGAQCCQFHLNELWQSPSASANLYLYRGSTRARTA